ncbi:unnamed protein product, partial [marine sediment metagenome]
MEAEMLNLKKNSAKLLSKLNEDTKKLLSNTYKTRLWLSRLDGGIFCQKEIELWIHIAGWGEKGCDSWNCKLGKVIGKSPRQVQRYLANLEYHHMIERKRGWAELEGGRFVKILRDRRIRALPWETKRAWMLASLINRISLYHDKNVALQKRTHKIRSYETKKE